MDRHFSFGYWVRRRRKALDLTQAELAAQVGCVTVTIRRIEADERRPSLQLATLLADRLHLPPEEHADFLLAARAERPVDTLVLSDEPLPTLTSSVRRPCHNLPAPSTELIGRDADLEILRGISANPHTRLMMLTGVGGSGKTRLALAFAYEIACADALARTAHLACPRDGVWWIDLAALRDRSSVLPGIAQALGIPAVQNAPLRDRLFTWLRERQLLLVLDNCEHVREFVADVVADMLATAPYIRIITTSRAILHVRGEHVVEVRPLALPYSGDTAAALCESHAGRLFITRAQAAHHGFPVTDDTAPAIIEICRRCDGLPLALELAAARTRYMGVIALLAQMTSNGDLSTLIGGANDLPARQRTIRATLQWSYDLLTADQQLCFRRIGVFVGGWTTSMAAMVVGQRERDADEPPDPAMVIGLLESLLDHSLIYLLASDDREQRFGMLEPVREFAIEQLVAHGEWATTQRRHAVAIAARVEYLDTAFDVADQRRAVTVLAAETPNCRAALGWALAEHAGDLPDTHGISPAILALRIGVAMYVVWRFHGLVSEGRNWLEQALQHGAHTAPTLLHAWAHFYAALFAGLQGDAQAVAQHARAVARMARQTDGGPFLAKARIAQGIATWLRGDYLGAARQFGRTMGNIGEQRAALGLGAFMYALSGDYRRAHRMAVENVALARNIGEPWALGESLQLAGFVAVLSGDLAQARPMLYEATRHYNTVGGDLHSAFVWQALGVVSRWRGEFDQALRELDTATAVARNRALLWANGALELEQAYVALDRGDVINAERMAVHGLAHWQQVNDTSGIAVATAVSAYISLAQGKLDHAEQLLAVVRVPAHTPSEWPVLSPQINAASEWLPRVQGIAGLLAAYQGKYPQARALIGAALADQRQPAFLAEIMRLRADLGRVCLLAGDLAGARIELSMSLAAFLRMDAQPMIARIVEDLAAVQARDGDLIQAVRWWSATTVWRTQYGVPRWPIDDTAFDIHIEVARQALGEQRFESACQMGQTLSLEATIAEVVRLGESLRLRHES